MNSLKVCMFYFFLLIFSSISFAQNWDNYEGRLHPDKTFHSLDGRLKDNKKISKTKIKSKDTQIKENKKVKEYKPPEIKNNTNQITPQYPKPPKTKPIKPARNNRWNYWINGLVFTILLCLIFIIAYFYIKPIRNLISLFNGCPLRLKIGIACLIASIITVLYLIIFNLKL